MMIKITFYIILILLQTTLYAETVLFQSSGNVYKMDSNDFSWKEVNTGYIIQTNIKIKTDEKSIAIVDINKKIKLYLRPNTILYFKQLNKSILLDLFQGAVQINSSNYMEDFIVTALLAQLKIESKNCLIKFINNKLLVSVFDNTIKLKNNLKTVDITQGKGLELNPGDNTFEVVSLPYPPIIESPENKSIITPGINLKWNSLKEAILYRVEIASDIDFLQIVVAREVSSDSFPIENLFSGEYFWRVASINRKNLEGLFFDNNRFTLQKEVPSLVIQKKETLPTDNGPTSEIMVNEDKIPAENTKNSIIFSSVILLSVIILIIL